MDVVWIVLKMSFFSTTRIHVSNSCFMLFFFSGMYANHPSSTRSDKQNLTYYRSKHWKKYPSFTKINKSRNNLKIIETIPKRSSTPSSHPINIFSIDIQPRWNAPIRMNSCDEIISLNTLAKLRIKITHAHRPKKKARLMHIYDRLTRTFCGRHVKMKFMR